MSMRTDLFPIRPANSRVLLGVLLEESILHDALVSRDMFDRKQQNRSKCCPEIARDAATIGSVQIHTQATRHTHDRIDRRKAVKERSPDQGRYKNFTTLHLATMSRGEQEDEGPTTRRIIRTGYQVTHITVPSNFPDSSVTL